MAVGFELNPTSPAPFPPAYPGSLCANLRIAPVTAAIAFLLGNGIVIVPFGIIVAALRAYRKQKKPGLLLISAACAAVLVITVPRQYRQYTQLHWLRGLSASDVDYVVVEHVPVRDRKIVREISDTLRHAQWFSTGKGVAADSVPFSICLKNGDGHTYRISYHLDGRGVIFNLDRQSGRITHHDGEILIPGLHRVLARANMRLPGQP